MERLGLGYEELRQRNTRLIYVTLTGYGPDGPYAKFAGHDVNYMALAGILDLIGPKNGPPVIPDVQIADIVGSMQTVVGVLLALQARVATGRGQRVDISMLDGSAALLALPLAFHASTGRLPERGNELLSGRFACYHLYQGRDARWLRVGALEHKFWANLCRELGCVEFISEQFEPDPRQSEIKTALAAIFRTLSAEEWFEKLASKDCCVAPVRNLEQAIADPHFQAYRLGLIPRLSDTPRFIDRSEPGLGEHTIEILERSGFDRRIQEALRLEGVIK